VNFFNAFAASFGSMLLMTAIICSWLFRSSTAPLIAKIAVPALIVAIACVTPYQVNVMLGLPISAPASLPAYGELIAFVAHNDVPLVDLWLRQRNAPPRAYETILNNKFRRILREAQSRLNRGERVMLVKALGTKRTDAKEQRAPDEAGYELDDSFFSFPPKE
jgi:hypothetical protein